MSKGKTYTSLFGMSDPISRQRSSQKSEQSTSQTTKQTTEQTSDQKSDSYAVQKSSNTSVAKNTSDTDTWAKTINRKRVEKETVLPSEIQSMLSTDAENGLPGFYLVPTIGAFYGVLNGRLFDELLLPPNENQPNFVERAVLHQYLKAWSDTERKALGLSVSPKKPTEVEGGSAVPDEIRSKSKPPPPNINKTEPIEATEEQRNKLFRHLPHARPEGVVPLSNDL